MNTLEIEQHKQIHQDIESFTENDYIKIHSNYQHDEFVFEITRDNFLKLIHIYPEQTLIIDNILTKYLDATKNEYDAYSIMIRTLESLWEIEHICMAINGNTSEDNFNANYERKIERLEFLQTLMEIREFRNDAYDFSQLEKDLNKLLYIRTPRKIRENLSVSIEGIVNDEKMKFIDKPTQQVYFNGNDFTRHHTITKEIFKQIFNKNKIEYQKDSTVSILKKSGKFKV